MDIKIIKKYIKDYSNPNSRSKATLVQPEFVKKTNNGLEYKCEGSSGETYSIAIDFIIETIETNCSCPYQYSYLGICKHTIACLNQYIKNPPSDNIDLFGEKSKPAEKQVRLLKNQILMPNGIITDAVINQFEQGYYSYYSDTKIVSVSQTEVITTTMGWDKNQQELKYNPQTSVLEFDCNCSKSKKKCEHLRKAFLGIVSVFGDNLFASNYMQEKTNAYLATVGFSPEDNYQEIFSFSITPKGFKVNSKYKNISSKLDDLTDIFENELTERITFLPSLKTQSENYGLGLCFEFDKKELNHIIPVRAKYNKAKTDFASSFDSIDFVNLNNFLIEFEDSEDQNLILKTLQINNLIEKFESHNQLDYIIKATETVKDILPKWKNTLIYKYDDRDTLVRKNLSPLSIEEKKIKLFFTLTQSDYFYTLKAKLAIDDKSYNLNASALSISDLFIIENETIIPILDTNLTLYIQKFKESPEINYLKKATPDFFEKIIAPLSKKFEIQSTSIKKAKATKLENEPDKQVYIGDTNGEYVTFKLVVQYGEKMVDVYSPELLLDIKSNSEKIEYTERNQSLEDNFIEEFKSLHPAFEEQETIFFLTPEQLFENYWMLHSTERMKQMGITVFGANELKSFQFNMNKPVIKVNLKSDIDWFDIEINISFGNQKASMKELQKAFLKKSNYVTLGDGTLGILPEEWMKKFATYFKTGEIKKNGIQISNYQFGIIDELYQEVDTKPSFLEELYNKKKRLQNISEIEAVPIPKGIKAKLRDYQHHGLNWLAFLDTNQLGGCLADDMGLGKTLQTITFLQYLKVKNPKSPPSLIIAPTSLIFNWNNEIEKFCPTLKMLTFTGASRLENKDNFDKYDLIISTYGSLLNDIEFLKDLKFNYVILDESQAIKNPNSKRYKAVRLLNSYNKIALTGTPIENNTFDLYAQLNFLNPGLLGNMSHFKTNFSDAIDKEKDFDASQILGKIITPFMLRRTKEQVATELPEKTESIIFCEMGKEQRGVYDTFKNKYRDYLLNKIDENGVEKSQMYILEGLTKLRQICNSTALIPTDEDFGNYSVKLETLIENIKEKTGKHKILVFSQFVKMLQIVKTRLEEDKIHYEYLDGQTTNRQEKVDNFQNNADVRVFLISLKAGGTGLNLTEADYVFIIDPWWNPAVENQAIDRCYRIGQTKKVMAYRMICKDTIEEKIVTLQQKKKNVASSIINIDQDEKKSFNINEVKELFR